MPKRHNRRLEQHFLMCLVFSRLGPFVVCQPEWVCMYKYLLDSESKKEWEQSLLLILKPIVWLYQWSRVNITNYWSCRHSHDPQIPMDFQNHPIDQASKIATKIPILKKANVKANINFVCVCVCVCCRWETEREEGKMIISRQVELTNLQ